MPQADGYRLQYPYATWGWLSLSDPLSFAGDKPSARHAPCDAWFARIASMRNVSSVHWLLRPHAAVCYCRLSLRESAHFRGAKGNIPGRTGQNAGPWGPHSGEFGDGLAQHKPQGLPGRPSCAQQHSHVHSNGKALGRRHRRGKKRKSLVPRLHPIATGRRLGMSRLAFHEQLGFRQRGSSRSVPRTGLIQ